MSSEFARRTPERQTIDPGIAEPRSVASPASTRPTPPRPSEYRPDPDRWMALGVCLAAGFMTLLDVSIVNVALPSIEQGLHAQPNELEWIVAGYALSLGLLLVPAGRFGDAHGRRPVFMVGVALFVVASAACALAPSALWLVLMRIVQGFAGGLISPQISGLIQSLFRGEERGRAFGLFGSTIGVSTAIGPLTGGALIALFGVHDGWRAVFFVNLPIGAAILLLARRYLPAPTAAERRRQTLDPLGVILLGAAVVCILLPFIEQRTWHGSLRLALFPLAAVLLVMWVRHERRYGAPASRSCRSSCSGSAPTCSAPRWVSSTSPGSSRCSSSSPSTCSSG
jgi:MFS family permease